jgi:hypothetical protein
VPVDNLKNVENENTPKDNFFSLHLYWGVNFTKDNLPKRNWHDSSTSSSWRDNQTLLLVPVC